VLLVLVSTWWPAAFATDAPVRVVLDEERAAHLAGLALRCIATEYPNKLSHTLQGDADVRPPRELHPAFFGCFDWHSSVHGHWMLVRLLRLFPALPAAAELRTALERNLSAPNIAAEVAYLQAEGRASFERTYGWAWLLKLQEELRAWPDDAARRWATNLQPLADEVASGYIDFLPRQYYPIRRGVHANTAFGIAFALDYARATGHAALEALLVERATAYYADDRRCPGDWEPDGDDFLSPCLQEADLMRRVLPRADFEHWLRDFLPPLAAGGDSPLLTPAVVTDRSDPKLVHLDGLNLSRAWCLYGIAAALSDDQAGARLVAAADDHLRATLGYVSSGNYEGEHWLASFAVFALSSR
jgi:hypothetical protein